MIYVTGDIHGSIDIRKLDKNKVTDKMELQKRRFKGTQMAEVVKQQAMDNIVCRRKP